MVPGSIVGPVGLWTMDGPGTQGLTKDSRYIELQSALSPHVRRHDRGDDLAIGAYLVCLSRLTEWIRFRGNGFDVDLSRFHQPAQRDDL